MNVSKRKLYIYWEVVFNSKTKRVMPWKGYLFILAQAVRRKGNSSVFEGWDICIAQLIDVIGNYAYFKRVKDLTDDKVESYSIVIRKKVKLINNNVYDFTDRLRKYPQTWILGVNQWRKDAEEAAESLKKTIPSANWTDYKGETNE